jgi:hypothetical protein
MIAVSLPPAGSAIDPHAPRVAVTQVLFGSVRDDLAGGVHRTLEPAHVSVWISHHN